jgi:hypothetical protein
LHSANKAIGFEPARQLSKATRPILLDTRDLAWNQEAKKPMALLLALSRLISTKVGTITALPK